MRPALLALLSALAVAWYLPAPLTRLTAHGASARLGLAAWLTAMASVLALLLVALQFLIRAAVDGWSRLAEAVCRSVAGGACGPAVYQSAIFELALGLATLTAALALAMLGWRYGRSVQQGQRRTRAHAEIARMTARRLAAAGTSPGRPAHPLRPGPDDRDALAGPHAGPGRRVRRGAHRSGCRRGLTRSGQLLPARGAGAASAQAETRSRCPAWSSSWPLLAAGSSGGVPTVPAVWCPGASPAGDRDAHRGPAGSQAR
jgi:hypothetical protein